MELPPTTEEARLSRWGNNPLIHRSLAVRGEESRVQSPEGDPFAGELCSWAKGRPEEREREQTFSHPLSASARLY